MKIALFLLMMISFTVIANLLLKLGANDDALPFLFGVFSGRTIVGFAAFAAAGLIYAQVLRYLPLNIAQSYAAAQFVAVILSSRLILGEPVPFGRWVGISMIMSGILLVAYYQAR